MRVKIEFGSFRFEVALDVAKLTPDVVPDDTVARLAGARI
jgi:hypothetical protein